MAFGPVQILVVGFDDPEFDGKVLDELKRLKESDTIRLIDLLVLRKDENGNLERFHRSDLGEAELKEFGSTVGALIGLGMGEDEETLTAAAALGSTVVPESLASEERGQWYVDDTIPNDTAAAVALIEHRWAIGLRDAIGEAGGFHLADAWIHPEDLVAVGVMAAEEAEKEKATA
jgi:hypothetical protein